MGQKNSVPILKVETKDGHRNASAKRSTMSGNSDQASEAVLGVSGSKPHDQDHEQGSGESANNDNRIHVKEAISDDDKKRTKTGKSRNTSANIHHAEVHGPGDTGPNRDPPPPLPGFNPPGTIAEASGDLEDSLDSSYTFDNEGMPRLRRRTLSPIGSVKEENQPTNFSRFANGRVGGLGPRSRPRHLSRTTPGAGPPSNRPPATYDPIKVSMPDNRSASIPRVANFHTSHLGDIEDSPEGSDNERDTVASLRSHSDSEDSIEDFFNASLLGSPRHPTYGLDNQTVSKLWQAPSGVYVPIVEIRDEKIFPEIGQDHAFITEYSFAEDIARVEVMELPEDVHLCVRGSKAVIHSGLPAPETLLRTSQPLPASATLISPRLLPLPQPGWSHNGGGHLPNMGPPPKKLEKLDLKAEKRRFRKNSLSSDISDTISVISLRSSIASCLTIEEGTHTVQAKSRMKKKLEKRRRKSGTVRPSNQRPMSLHLPKHVAEPEVSSGRLVRARSWPLLISKDEGTQTELPLRRSCGQSLASLFRRMLGRSAKVTPREPKARARTDEDNPPPEGPRAVWDQDGHVSDSSAG